MEESELTLLARAGAELAVMFEMVYAPQDSAAAFIATNPEGATLLRDIEASLSSAGSEIPAELAFLLDHIRAQQA